MKKNHRATFLSPTNVSVSFSQLDFEVSADEVPVETKHDEEKDRKEVPKEAS